MPVRVDEVSNPATLQEALLFLKRYPEAVPWAGGTLLMTDSAAWPEGRGTAILDVHRIPELSSIHRTERYIEVGAAYSLSSILALPGSSILDPLTQAIGTIGNAAVRNLATLGGNIAARGRFMTSFPALSCLDASVELRDSAGVRWHGIHKLVGPGNQPSFPRGTLLTRVRLPVAKWDSIAIKSIGEKSFPHPDANAFCACARYDKGAISDIRIATAGRVLVRDRELELTLAGKHLPLTRRELVTFATELAALAYALSASRNLADRLEAYVTAFLARSPEYIS